MAIGRRGFLAAGAALVAVPAFGQPAGAPVVVRAAGTSPAFQDAFARLFAYAGAELAGWTFPAMTLSLRSAAGETATAAIGFANLDAREPVTTDHLFQIGSISKSFVALALLRLADQGRIDLDRPVLAYAPDMPIADARVTAMQILAHSAGLPGNAPPFPVETGGRLWTATTPGTRFSYSNSGYDALALLIQRASGTDFASAVTRLVLEPLGMAASRATILTPDRAGYARGYSALRRGMAWFPGDPLAEGSWLDVDRAAGSVASTPADMARYIGFIGACATGRPQALLSPASATRFVTALVDAPIFGPGARYGAGLATVMIDDQPALHHTGGMITFSSSLTVDKASGAGAFASVNISGFGGYRPRAVTTYGVRLARALAAGAPLPPAPEVVTLGAVAGGADLAGRWVGPGGMEILVVPDGNGLALSSGGVRGRLQAAGNRRLITDHPGLAPHALAFEGETGRAERMWWGSGLFARDVAPAQPAVPDALRGLAGLYRSNDPWVGSARVTTRGSALWVESDEIVPHPDGSWRFVSPAQVTERVWFSDRSNGVMQRLSMSGEAMFRAT